MDTDVEKANSAVTSDRAGIPVLTRLYRELKERLATSDRAPDPVDVLIIGGGIQGLVLLETLTKRGYSTGMVTNGPLGHGQSLHAHGFLESGYTMPDPELRASVVEDWLPYLDENDISVYGEWFFIAPDGPVSALQPKWDAGGYPYETVSVDDLPTEYHVSDLFADGTDTNVVAIHEYCFPKRQLVQRLAEGHEDRILSGDITDFGVEQSGDAYVLEWVDVHDHTTGERVRLTPSHAIVAAGGGTPKVVGEIADAVGEAGGDGATVRASVDQVTFDRVHMLTLRGPPEALPDVSAVIPPKKLKIVSHRSVGPGEKDLVTWYVTKKPLSPIPPEDATAEALVSVDPEHTAASFNTLFAAVPGIRESVVDGTIECYVYAGFDILRALKGEDSHERRPAELGCLRFAHRRGAGRAKRPLLLSSPRRFPSFPRGLRRGSVDSEVLACLASVPALSRWGAIEPRSGTPNLSDCPDVGADVPRRMNEETSRGHLSPRRAPKVNDDGRCIPAVNSRRRIRSHTETIE
jgi:hypothetical protein